MSVDPSDIEFRYTGGAGNTNPNSSLGGAMSTAGGGVVDHDVLHDLFDALSPSELASDTEYRCICVKNADGVDTLADARAYVNAQPAQSGHALDIAVAAEAVNVAPATIANESTAPVGVTFTRPSTYAAGLALNSATGLAPGAFKGLWVRRTATAAVSGTITGGAITVEGTTL